MLLLDLDGFKEINDRLGHQTGDRVLQGIADQLTRLGAEASVIARLGGDEFAVLIPDVGVRSSDVGECRTAAHRAHPADPGRRLPAVGRRQHRPCLHPAHGRTAEDVSSAADVAMYRAKRYRTGVESYKTIGSRPSAVAWACSASCPTP